MESHVFLSRVLIKNYKSIGGCDVHLRPLSFLVGPNGSGKSNFLDALRFVADSLNLSLEHALRDRGGVNDVRRRSSGHPTHFGIRLEFALPSGQTGHYAFRIGAKAHGGYEVQTEECVLRPQEAFGVEVTYRAEGGSVVGSIDKPPAAIADRLYLVSVSGIPDFRPVFDALSRMGFYNLRPDVIRDLQSPDPRRLLARDGRNLATVVSQLATQTPAAKKRVEEYLAKIVPGVHAVDHKVIGPKETLEFRQDVAGARNPWRFLAASMSDGTLRALGVLVAIFQSHNGTGPPVTLVGLEEPEAALHPAAAGVLLDALREASTRTQVIVTSHSPDLLDSPDIDTDAILAVTKETDTTIIGAVNEGGRRTLRDNLYTPGELLRLDQLSPSTEARKIATGNQLSLFGPRGN